MNANEKREAVAAKYREIIGRNNYSQSLRNYCYKKYSNGKYYSDCSSSVSYAYKEAGYWFGILNTVGMYQCKKFTSVPVTISAGQIKNPELLRVGDMLLYAGGDSSRAYAGYVGHVEMVGEISGGKYILYGHGSGTPKKTEMVAKNKSRYNTKASTKLGHRGLIRVVRFIQDDGVETPEDTTPVVTETTNNLKVRKGSWNIRSAPGTDSEVIGTVTGSTEVEKVNCDGWVFVQKGNIKGFISKNALEG